MTKRGAIAAACALLLIAACSDDNEICSDGADNDDNTLVDCEDPACGSGAACGPHGRVCADLTCSACSGNGGVAEAAGEATCGDGVDNDCDGAVDCEDADCQPQDGSPGRVCDATGNTCTAPDVAGRAPCGLSSGGGGGTFSPIGLVRLAQAEHQVLGAFGSGYREQSLLTFEVIAADGAPFPGVAVKFSHVSLGGSFIGPVATCTAASPSVCTAQGTTDGSGRVAVLLRSGTRFAALSVRAEATTGGTTRSHVAGGFTVVGAKPNGARLSLDCRPYNVPALTDSDCLYSRYKGDARNVECTATLGDRHGNIVGVPTLVGFQSEAGAIVPAALTPAYEPAGGGLPLGQAIGTYDVYGAPLPFDVEPIPGESWYDDIDYRCGKRKANPRDGLVSVIAMVQGEEGFVDLDLDGKYDEGVEPFIDIGEPFLDHDDDGLRGFDEWYHDSNGDGSYTGPNESWDADTILWTQARVLYTGHPRFARDSSGRELFTRLYGDGLGAPPAPTPAAPQFAVYMGPPPTTEFYGVFFTDQHLNPLSSFTTFGAEAMVGNVTAKLTRPSATADSLGTSFRLLYCDQPDGPATCHDGPADQACLAPRCYLRTEVGREFTYGNYATLSVTCAQPGPDSVEVSASVEGVTSPMWISGECLP